MGDAPGAAATASPRTSSESPRRSSDEESRDESQGNCPSSSSWERSEVGGPAGSSSPCAVPAAADACASARPSRPLKLNASSHSALQALASKGFLEMQRRMEETVSAPALSLAGDARWSDEVSDSE